MKKIKILDCTLRDGAYVVNMIFGDNYIKNIIESLSQTGIDIIECGFLRNHCRNDGSTEFSNPNEIQDFIPNVDNKQTKYVVMIDSGRYDTSTLPPSIENSIFAIRNCFHKNYKEQAFRDAETIIEKGYEVFMQPTGILGYNDHELLELIAQTNALHAYSFAIVDTFGSMTRNDLRRLFYLIDHNLDHNIILSFHSHNNLQMAFALSQEFIELNTNKREIIVDTTVYGMGRGAGNANTELMLEYLNTTYQFNYDINPVLDLIDNRIMQIYVKKPWGYNIRNFVAGANSCHVDNISYLYDKGTIQSKDIKMILEEIPPEERKHFNKDILENACYNFNKEHINDSDFILELTTKLEDKNVLLLFPGRSLSYELDNIKNYIKIKSPIVISINFSPTDIAVDYIFCSNPNRFDFMKDNLKSNRDKLIITSNIQNKDIQEKINIFTLIKRGWKYYDNSGILCLRLLDRLNVNEIHFAGFDGYNPNYENYVIIDFEKAKSEKENQYLNFEIGQMLKNFKETMHKSRKIDFITPSIFEDFL